MDNKKIIVTLKDSKNNWLLDLEVSLDEKVDDLKYILGEIFGFRDLSRMKLIVDGKSLEYGRTLDFYKIIETSVIRVVCGIDIFKNIKADMNYYEKIFQINSEKSILYVFLTKKLLRFMLLPKILFKM